MATSLKNEIVVQINELFHQAEEAKNIYNWNNAIQDLENAKKICLEHNLKESEGEIYYKLGEIYHIASQ